MKATYRTDFLPMRKSLKIWKLKILPNISNHNCFYGVYEDEDLMNTTYGPVDEGDTDDSSSEFGMLNPDLLDLDLPVQGNVVNTIGPVSFTVEDISVTRDEFYALCS